MGKKLVSLRKIEDLEFMKVKMIDLAIWDFFWHILKILGTNLNLYKIVPCQMPQGINMTCGTNITHGMPRDSNMTHQRPNGMPHVT